MNSTVMQMAAVLHRQRCWKRELCDDGPTSEDWNYAEALRAFLTAMSPRPVRRKANRADNLELFVA